MKKLNYAVDYRKLRLNNLNSPTFSHLKLLLYWLFYGIMFFLFERVLPLTFHTVYSPIDDFIPFCEFFVIPYYFWFVFMVGMLVYSLLFNIETFKKYMWYIILTYSITMFIYAVYPTSQSLRPISFARHNIFTTIVTMLYSFDTNTNVCPSMHVIGSFAVLLAAWNDKNLSSPRLRLCFVLITVAISMSTLFLKQHSIVDVITAIVLCYICYPIVFKRKSESFAQERTKCSI